MHEIMLHEHWEKGLCSQICDDFIETMHVALIETDRLALDELFDQDFVGRLRVCFGEGKMTINYYTIESIDVLLFLEEWQLFGEYSLERLVGDGDFEKFWKKWQKLTEIEE